MIKYLEQGQGKRGRLAGPGLRGGEQVAAGQDDGNGLRLDRGGFGIALLGHGTQQLGRQAKGIERRIDGISPERSAWEASFQPVQAETTKGKLTG